MTTFNWIMIAVYAGNVVFALINRPTKITGTLGWLCATILYVQLAMERLSGTD